MGQRGVSNDRAFEREIGGINRRLTDLSRLIPGKDGGGSVSAPFSIGGTTFGDDTAQVVLSVLAQLSHPVSQEYEAVFDQGVTTSLARDRAYDDFLIIGPFVYWRYNYSIRETGTAGSALMMSIPVMPISGNAYELGMTLVYDSSGATRYNCMSERLNDGSQRHQFGAEGGSGNLWGVSPNLAVDNGDIVRGWCFYRFQ